ncbi:hypothetical protein A3L12_05290 [Thermococcus sp. P6]|uniref:hypothetical protein n=1 Tax=Thermococcus sp. P6 TaxID=122420 RepID=UPI000B599706|nr:hypothetical protein [Thermococcus sp. P6]ASJ10751.1 hypothetical protein A3L12_05290 [Thermococcus sp. P6]
MLKEIAGLDEGVVLITGDGKRIARVYLNSWAKRGKRILAEGLPFRIEGEVYLGSPFENDGFDVYLLIDPLSRSKADRKTLREWISSHRDRLVLLYERRYVKDSITRYRLRELLDYLVAYRRETVGFERIDVMRFEGGRVVESRTYVRKH